MSVALRCNAENAFVARRLWTLSANPTHIGWHIDCVC
jgi:hypothetical protein